MSETTNYIINISGNAEITLDKIAGATDKATGKFAKFRDTVRSVGNCMFALNNINDALQRVGQTLNNAIQPGIAFNSSLTDLSAITNVTGDKLKEIGVYARDNAKVFGGSAAQGVESFKLLLSQLSPEIAKVPAALDAMGKNVSILSKTMGGDTTAAAEVLTTAMNQFQVSLDNPIAAASKMAEMMNVMAAAAQAGSAEMPQIKAALENSGMAAKSAGVSFEELNAAIQVLDKAGKKGAEGGIAIRNALSIFSEGRFMNKKTQDALNAAGISVDALGDKSKSLTDRLRLLRPVMNDSALMSQLFGRENSNAGLALISGIEQIDEYTKAITGTTSAQDQAKIVMGGFAERMSRMTAKFDDWKIKIFDITKGAIPAFTTGASIMQGAVSTLTLFNMIACISESAWMLAIKEKLKKLRESTVATWAAISANGTFIPVTLGAAVAAYVFSKALKAVGTAIYNIPIIGWIALGITLLVGLFTLLWNKSQKFREVLFGVWESVKAVFYNIGVVIKAVWENIIKPIFMLWFNTWKAIITGIIDAAVWLWNGLVAVFTAVGQFIYDYVVLPIWHAILWAINGIASFFSRIWNWVSGVFSGIASWLDKNLLSPIKGVFSKMWDFIGGILDKIINALMKPIKWIKELWNKVFPKDQFKDVTVAYNVGVKKGTESWNESQKKKKNDTGAGLLENNGMGTNDALQNAGGNTSPVSPTNPAGGAANAIATGGTRNTSINITVKSMIENIQFSGSTKESMAEIERNLAEGLYRVLAMAEVSAT